MENEDEVEVNIHSTADDDESLYNEEEKTSTYNNNNEDNLEDSPKHLDRDRDEYDKRDDKKSRYSSDSSKKSDKAYDKHSEDRKSDSYSHSRSKSRYSPYPSQYYKPHYGGGSPPHYPPPQYISKSRNYHPNRNYHSDYPYPDPYYHLPPPPPPGYDEPPYYAPRSQPPPSYPHPAIVPPEKDYQPRPPPSAPASPPPIINGDVASKVIHFRNVVSSITQQDIMSLCSPFGEVYQVVMLSDKNQALVQMAELSSAIQFLQYFSDVPINIRGRKVYARFSRHPELRHNNMIANKVILVTFQSELPLYQLTIDIVWQLFSYYGGIEKIVMVNKEKTGEAKSTSRQALVQFSGQASATAALDTLTGESVFIGDPPTKTSLHIQYSNLTSLIVKQQTSEARDYSLDPSMSKYPHYPPNPPRVYNYSSYHNY